MDMKKHFYIIFLSLFFACKGEGELAIERGIQFYDWGKYDEAIIVGFRTRLSKIREKYFTYIIFLFLFSLCIFSYIIIIMTVH